MKKLLFRIAGILAALSAPLIISSVAHAASITWSGGGTLVSGAYNVSDVGNWVGGVAPTTGDILVFPMTVPAAQRHINNDLAIDTSLGGIQFTGTNADCTASPSLTISGNRLVLTGDISDSSTGCSIAFGAIDLTLGANIAVNNTGTSYMSFGPVDGTGTLTVGAFTLTFNDSSSSINYKLVGGGVVSISKDTSLFSDNSGFTGAINVLTGNSLTANGGAKSLGAASATVTVPAGAVVTLCGSASTTTIFPQKFSLAGDGINSVGALIAVKYCGSGAGGAYVPANTQMSGAVTLTANTVIQANDNLTLTGALSGSFTITSRAGSTGVLTISSTPNTSLTPSGAQQVQITTTTYSDSLPSTVLSVGQTEIAIVTGARGDTTVTGTLKGTGTVGILTIMPGAHLAPGMSPGCISSGNLTLSGTFDAELGGLTACTQYDLTNVTGTVDVTGGTLNVIRYNNMVPRLNNHFTIISNDASDAVTGTFTGLAQGASFTSDGITYTISYTGGDGNDVVLTVTAVSASLGAPNTGFVQLLKSGVALPILAMLSGFAVLGLQTITRKRK